MRDPAVSEGCRACSVEAQQCNFVIGKKRLQFCADIAAVSGEPSQKALDDVVERHVVVAGYGNHRPGQFLEKGAGGGELPVAGALRQVAGDDSEVRLRPGYVGQQALGRGLVVPPEMQIGEMGNRSHDKPGSATITRSAPGRMR